MSTFGDSQVRNLFLSNLSALATGTPDAEGEIGVVKDADGNIAISMFKGGEVYNAAPIEANKILSQGDKKMVINKKTYTITLSGTPVVGESVELVVYLDSFGAHNTTDATNIRGWHKVKTASADAVAAGLADTLTLTLNKSAINGITVTAAGAVITVVMDRSDFKLGKFDGKVHQGRVLFNGFSSEVTGAVAETLTKINNGVEVANLEWFAEGNRGDIYRGVGYPNNFDSVYIADATADYEFYELAFYSERISAPGDKQRQMVTIAGNTTLIGLVANAIES